MARVRARRARDRADVLTFAQGYKLRTGWDLGGPAFDDEATMREAWELHRDELTERFARGRPGHRPWAFWRYDHPEGLRDVPDHAPELYDPRRLVPRQSSGDRYLAAIRATVAYLARHALLYPFEVAAIRDPASRRVDGELHAWDRAALEALAL